MGFPSRDQSRLHLCAHSSLTTVEALKCNYGNQRWVKITLRFFTVIKLCSGVTLCIHYYFPARSDLFCRWMNEIAILVMDRQTVNWNLFARLSITPLTRELHLEPLRKTIFATKCHGMALSCASVMECFHHVIKNYVSLHNSVILLHMTPVLVYK